MRDRVYGLELSDLEFPRLCFSCVGGGGGGALSEFSTNSSATLSPKPYTLNPVSALAEAMVSCYLDGLLERHSHFSCLNLRLRVYGLGFRG